MAHLNVRLLGPFQATRKKQAIIDFETAKARALLAYLAVEADRPHQREALAEMLWPDRPEGAARANLRHTLTGLRRAIGDDGAAPPYLLITRQTIQFSSDSDARVDVAEFESLAAGGMATGCLGVGQLEEAAGLYRGAFLEGVSVGDSAGFEEWTLVKREQFSRQALGVLDRLAEWYRQVGDHERALAYARQRVELEPWDEKGQRQVMRLLAYSDQRGAALAQYEVCVRELGEELGVGPEEGTVALYERIRDEGLEAPPRAPGFLYEGEEGAEGERTPFVAREVELARLGEFLEVALGGRGQVVFVSGEAGSGKTALAQAFVREAQEAHPELVVVGGNGVAYTGLGDPYHPFREVLRQLSGEAEARWRAGAMTAEHARRLWNTLPLTVQALVSDGPDLVDTFVGGRGLVERARACGPAEAGWLDELEGLVERKALSPAGAGPQQSALFGQYTRVVQAVARQAPILLILDDLQWADVGSISLLFHMGREMAGSRMLVVGVYRPEEVALGRGGERHPLEPVVNELRREQGEVTVDLGQAEGREFVEALLDSEANRLGAGFRETLYRQTRGHPLFTVELLRGMEERGDLVRDGEGRWVEGEALDWERLPARVEAVIAERVGRLVGGLRETLAVASVEGEEFTAEVVARAGGVDEEQVVQRLSGELDRKHRLVSTQGIMRAGGQRLSRYRFRHILFQRYAYGSLDRVRRSHLHEAVGTALEGLYGDKVDEVAVELARHFQEGGNVGKAISYLGRAGQQAVRVSANEEAIAHLTQALALLGTLPETLERDGQELMLQVGLIAALQSTRGYEDAGVGRACARARELCGRVGELPQRFLVLWLLALYHASRSELGIARGLAEELHSLAGQVEGVVLSAMAEFALEWISLLRGQYDSARAHMERATALYDAELHRPVRSLYGTDPGLASLVYGCFVLWLMGYPEQALQQSRTALALAKELDDPFNIALAQGALSRLHVARRDVGTVHDLSRACVRLAIQRGFPYWIAVGIFCQGWALAEKGQVEEGIALMRQSMAGYRATGAECGYPHQLTDLAGVYGRVGRAEEGLALVDEALEMARSNDERWYEPETHRTKGELLLLRGTDEAQAEDCFQRAIELAGQQSARMWKLRATVSLCRLWQRQGKRRKALKQLAQIYDGFSEGFDTPDLQEAQALLEEMG